MPPEPRINVFITHNSRPSNRYTIMRNAAATWTETDTHSLVMRIFGNVVDRTHWNHLLTTPSAYRPRHPFKRSLCHPLTADYGVGYQCGFSTFLSLPPLSSNHILYVPANNMLMQDGFINGFRHASNRLPYNNKALLYDLPRIHAALQLNLPDVNLNISYILLLLCDMTQNNYTRYRALPSSLKNKLRRYLPFPSLVDDINNRSHTPHRHLPLPEAEDISDNEQDAWTGDATDDAASIHLTNSDYDDTASIHLTDSDDDHMEVNMDHANPADDAPTEDASDPMDDAPEDHMDAGYAYDVGYDHGHARGLLDSSDGYFDGYAGYIDGYHQGYYDATRAPTLAPDADATPVLHTDPVDTPGDASDPMDDASRDPMDAEGYEEDYAEGYAEGQADGLLDGYASADGYADGRRQGYRDAALAPAPDAADSVPTMTDDST